MITDVLSNAGLYRRINQSWGKAFDFLMQCKQQKPEPGRYPIDGDNVYAIVQRYETSEPDRSRWEAHKSYIDIQCVMSGRELIGYASADRGLLPTEYNPEKDVCFYGDARDNVMLSLEEDQFAVFLPGEIHKPHVIWNEKCTVDKIVIKIKQ